YSSSSSASLKMVSCGESASSRLRSDLGENSLWRSRATCFCNCRTRALSRTGSSGRESAPDFMAPDYTGSAHKTRGQYLVWLVPPEVETGQQLIQFPHRQHDGPVSIGLGLETLGLQTLEPQTEAVAFPVEDFHPVAGFVEEDEQHRVEHGHLDIQL